MHLKRVELENAMEAAAIAFDKFKPLADDACDERCCGGDLGHNAQYLVDEELEAVDYEFLGCVDDEVGGADDDVGEPLEGAGEPLRAGVPDPWIACS